MVPGMRGLSLFAIRGHRFILFLLKGGMGNLLYRRKGFFCFSCASWQNRYPIQERTGLQP
jgi:hypothetical protein